MTEYARLACSRCDRIYRQDLVHTNPNDGQYWCDGCFQLSEWIPCQYCELWFSGSAMHTVPKTDSPAYIQICASCQNKRLTRARRFAD